MAVYSRFGEHGACWLLLGGTGATLDARPSYRQRWLRGVKIVAASYGLNFLVKLALRRRRPELKGLPPLTATVSRLSFPSAHCTTSFAAARAVLSKARSGTAATHRRSAIVEHGEEPPFDRRAREGKLDRATGLACGRTGLLFLMASDDRAPHPLPRDSTAYR